MAYLKVERKKSGTYLRILESYRNDSGKPTSRTLFSLGKLENYKPEDLRNIGVKLFELGGGQLKGLLSDDVHEIGRYNYGYQKVFGKALAYYGLERIFNRIAKSNKLQFDLYKAVLLMLLERWQQPCSKLSNFNHRGEYLDLGELSLQHLYRSLDKLAKYNELIQGQIYQTGRGLFNQQLDIVFYDVTTFYFCSEVENQGALRQMGFGKDGKVGKTQVLFGMLIDREKNPIGYKIYSGNTYEGSTYESALNDLKNRYSIDKVIVVADRGMLSKKNLDITTEKGYEFILGERLKSLPKVVKEQLTDRSQYKKEWKYIDAYNTEVGIEYKTFNYEGRTIIGTYSQRRAKKDKADRDEKIEKAEQLLKRPSSLNTKAGHFYIKTDDNQEYVLDEEKIKNAEKYDGFLAISTNNKSLDVEELLDQYKQLFKIEQSFRTFKSHLETRPMFHWTDKRIEGHICLCYIAFAMQNYVLRKVNEGTSTNKITEKVLRETLDKMQVSLIEHDGKQSYLRSNPTEAEKQVLSRLKLKPILPLQKKEAFRI